MEKEIKISTKLHNVLINALQYIIQEEMSKQQYHCDHRAWVKSLESKLTNEITYVWNLPEYIEFSKKVDAEMDQRFQLSYFLSLGYDKLINMRGMGKKLIEEFIQLCKDANLDVIKFDMRRKKEYTIKI